jgi:hypothetical protein
VSPRLTTTRVHNSRRRREPKPTRVDPETGTGNFPLGFPVGPNFGPTGLDKIPLRQDSWEDEKRQAMAYAVVEELAKMECNAPRTDTHTPFLHPLGGRPGHRSRQEICCGSLNDAAPSKGAQMQLRTFEEMPSPHRSFQHSLTICCRKLLPAPQLSSPRLMFHMKHRS